MVAGADTMQDILAADAKSVIIIMATVPFESTDALKRIRLRDPSTGGDD